MPELSRSQIAVYGAVAVALLLLGARAIRAEGSDGSSYQPASNFDSGSSGSADNGFTLGGIVRDRKRGTASITATTSNPGIVTVSGKGLRKRASKSLAVAGPVTFQLTPTGRTARRLVRKGRVTIALTVTFLPSGGEPSSQSIHLKLLQRKQPVVPV